MSNQSSEAAKRRPGRPPTYVFSKPDSELSENERRLKSSVIKRRLRQNRQYHKKKRLKQLQATTLSLPTLPPLSIPLPSPFPSLSSPSQNNLPSQGLFAQPFVTTTSQSLDPPTQSSISLLLTPPPRLPLTTTTSTPPLSSPPHFSISNFLPNPPTQSDLSTTAHSPVPTLRATSPTGRPTTPVLPLQIAKPPTAQDTDEDELLDEIFQESSLSLATSAKMVQRAASPSFLGTDIIARTNNLPKHIADGLKHLLLFPRSFSSSSARHIMNLTNVPIITFPAQILQPLVDANLIRPTTNGRFELSEITKSVLNLDSYASANEARVRFIEHFTAALRGLDPQSLSVNGEHRLKAMKLYDSERVNMSAALRMCRDMGNTSTTMAFLTNGATVMRYSTAPHERVLMFTHILQEIEMNDSPTSAPSEMHSVFEARIRLALGEAYFDMLDFDNAKEHLKMAFGTMAGSNARNSITVSTSVLALVLLAELRISDREFEEARKLILKSLRTLKDNKMQRSTFAVCCLLSLASVFSSIGRFDKAMKTVNFALDILGELGFTDMPIHADALRTLGTVHFRAGALAEAQTIFLSALNIIQKWMSRTDWESAPFQHCTHLDIFLMENVGKTHMAMGRVGEGQRLINLAKQERQGRKLESKDTEPSESMQMDNRDRIYTRHLY